MHAPGVEVRPLRQITGEAEFNEIFFSDVEVPVENRLGDEGDGWQVAMTTLLHERATLGFALTATLDALFGRLLEEAEERDPEPLVREALAREWIELQALRYTSYRALGTYERTGDPRARGLGREAALVGGEPAPDEARARAARAGRASSTTAGGTTSSSAAAATRSRPGPRKSSATSSPSASSASRGRADGLRAQRGPVRAEAGGARVARRPLPARPGLGRPKRPLERARASSAGSTSRRRGSASSKRRCSSRRRATSSIRARISRTSPGSRR